jgi:L-threonylcarbamoyladenylate synthase
MSTPAELARAADLLRRGRLVVFPTETVYGLGANALDAEAVARIYAVKGRPATSPLIVHVATIEMAKSLASAWPEAAERLTEKFWPGPFTVVVKKQPTVPDIVTAGLQTVALRMPSHPIALALIRAAGIPLAAPSANRFTELSPTTAEHVRRSLGKDVDLILDGGPCQIGIESTVLSLAGERPVLLRPGAISRSEIEALIGPVASAPEALEEAQKASGETREASAGCGNASELSTNGKGTSSTRAVTGAKPTAASSRWGTASPRENLFRSPLGKAPEGSGKQAGRRAVGPGTAHPSPGMHARHYSPRTPLLLVSNGKLPEQGNGIYLQHAHGPNCPTQSNRGLESATASVIPMVQVIQMPQSASDYAAALYKTLHDADQANADWIAVDLPPNAPEWEAVQDRLRRAASKE